jgi:hypothetical protein
MQVEEEEDSRPVLIVDLVSSCIHSLVVQSFVFQVFLVNYEFEFDG